MKAKMKASNKTKTKKAAGQTKRTAGETEVQVERVDKVAKPKKIKAADMVVKRKGQRKVPTATDKHGCTHTGLLGLMALPKKYLRSYLKENGWLHNKPCRDCGVKEEGERGSGKVLELSCLLSRKGGQDEVGYYCNCGPTGFGMDDDDENKAAWTCDMVLCMECYSDRKNKMGNEGGGRNRNKRKLNEE
jgi:hypothetical protein